MLQRNRRRISQPNEGESSRWWEFYAVRYAMGTVIGGIAVFWLCVSNPVLQPLLFGINTGTLDGARLALLVGYGLAYCYIASAPILVFHVGRYLWEPRPSVFTSWKRLFLLFGIPLLATATFYCSVASEYDKSPFFTLSFALAVFVLWPQCLVIGATFFKSKELLSFYQNLANKRSRARGGITDSYKHMREHGNSFAIVLLEVLLAVLLYAAWNYSAQTGANNEALIFIQVGVVFAWVSPAALVWVVGTRFEREFADA